MREPRITLLFNNVFEMLYWVLYCKRFLFLASNSQSSGSQTASTIHKQLPSGLLPPLNLNRGSAPLNRAAHSSICLSFEFVTVIIIMSMILSSVNICGQTIYQRENLTFQTSDQMVFQPQDPKDHDHELRSEHRLSLLGP